jgi:hypothetical protein
MGSAPSAPSESATLVEGPLGGEGEALGPTADSAHPQSQSPGARNSPRTLRPQQLCVAFAAADSALGERLAEHLQALGVQVATVCAKQSGSAEAIARCAVFMPLLSCASLRDRACEQASLRAHKLLKDVLPVLVDREADVGAARKLSAVLKHTEPVSFLDYADEDSFMRCFYALLPELFKFNLGINHFATLRGGGQDLSPGVQCVRDRVHEMYFHGNDAAFCYESMQLFGEAALDDSEDGIAWMVRLGVIPCIMQAMRNFRTAQDIILCAFIALINILHDSVEARVQAINEGLSATVVNLMALFADDVQTQRFGCQVLQLLAGSDRAVAEGCLSAASTAAQRHKDDGEVLAEACEVFRIVATSPGVATSAKLQLLKLNCASACDAALSDFPDPKSRVNAVARTAKAAIEALLTE